MIAFFTSLVFHIAVVVLLLASPFVFWKPPADVLKTIRITMVQDSQTADNTKNAKPKGDIAKEERPATTKLAAYNAPSAPTRRDDDRPETLLPPPKKQPEKAVSLAPPPEKRPKQSSITKPPVPKKRLQKSKTDTRDAILNKEQPIAAAPKRRPKKAKTLNSIIKSLQQRDNSAITSKQTKRAKTIASPPEKTVTTSQKTTAAVSAKNSITAADLAALHRQLSSCWTIISTDASLYQPVQIRLYFDETLRVRKLEFVEQDKYDNDPRYRVAAEQAQSAILHPACQPLALPREKISSDVVLLLNFNPQAIQRTP